MPFPRGCKRIVIPDGANMPDTTVGGAGFRRLSS